jgi:hypothetical protein
LLRLRPAGACLLEVGRCEQSALEYAGGELFLSGLQFGQVRDDGEEVDQLGSPLRFPCFGVDQVQRVVRYTAGVLLAVVEPGPDDVLAADAVIPDLRADRGKPAVADQEGATTCVVGNDRRHDGDLDYARRTTARHTHKVQYTNRRGWHYASLRAIAGQLGA